MEKKKDVFPRIPGVSVCAQCGTPLDPGDFFCPACGRKAGVRTQTRSHKYIFLIVPAAILLMLIGGAPGSTAGGMKTTTAAVLLLTSAAVFRRHETIRCFGRRIEESVVRDAVSILLMVLLGILLQVRLGIPLQVRLGILLMVLLGIPLGNSQRHPPR